MAAKAVNTLALSYGEGALPRAEHDHYVEPPEAVEALCSVERFVGNVLDPAAGTRSLILTIQRRQDTHATSASYAGQDVTDDPPCSPADDFLSPSWIPAIEPLHNIVTNPPYRLADEFALRSLSLASAKVALFLRLQWLEGQQRYERIFRHHPPTRIWALTWRPGFVKGQGGERHKGGMMAYAWFVWDLTVPPQWPSLRWLPRTPSREGA